MQIVPIIFISVKDPVQNHALHSAVMSIFSSIWKNFSVFSWLAWLPTLRKTFVVRPSIFFVLISSRLDSVTYLRLDYHRSDTVSSCCILSGGTKFWFTPFSRLFHHKAFFSPKSVHEYCLRIHMKSFGISAPMFGLLFLAKMTHFFPHISHIPCSRTNVSSSSVLKGLATFTPPTRRVRSRLQTPSPSSPQSPPHPDALSVTR